MKILLEEIYGVALGGVFGALSRFALSRYLQSITQNINYPIDILVCNVLGSLVIGVLAGFFLFRFGGSPFWRAMTIIGFLGSFTTFSSFSLDTINLLRTGAIGAAVSYIFISLFACLAATAIGMYITIAAIK